MNILLVTGLAVTAPSTPLAAQGPRVADARVAVGLYVVRADAERLPGDSSRGHYDAVGALVGGIVGAAALVAIASTSSQGTNRDGPGWGIALVALPLAIVGGAIVGALVGHFIPVRGEPEGPSGR